MTVTARRLVWPSLLVLSKVINIKAARACMPRHTKTTGALSASPALANLSHRQRAAWRSYPRNDSVGTQGATRHGIQVLLHSRGRSRRGSSRWRKATPSSMQVAWLSTPRSMTSLRHSPMEVDAAGGHLGIPIHRPLRRS